MADGDFSKSAAARASKIFCMDPEIQAFPERYKNALHMCKHEILAAVYRLYQVVPQADADKVLDKFFTDLPESLPRNGGLTDDPIAG
ncbi:hypothetical protein [Caulobacter sp. X]|uniref:hypothetical protein n=1 Tax=Caulobacter sp. X TaxID=2048901 RepID=UPI0011789EE6|nr:hypothetical protein [Caulobacter sp. X]